MQVSSLCSSALIAGELSLPTQGSGPPGCHRMEAELGVCRQGRTGRKHSPRSALGEIAAGGTPLRIPNFALPFACRRGCSCSRHRQQPAEQHHAHSRARTQELEQFSHSAAAASPASHGGVSKVILELPWQRRQKEPPTGTRSAPALAGQRGCQGLESPRKLQYDSLNYTNCVSWY